MSRVIAVANQKGGIGKTTTAVNVAYDLAAMGKKVLLIDTDGQCNSTDTCRAQVDGVATLYDLLFNHENVEECIQHMELLDVIASDKLLRNPEKKFADDATRLFTMRDACEEIRDKYDFIIVDTPPSLGCMLSNVLTFADEVIIPVTCDRYGMRGIEDLYATISATKKYTNQNLKVTGVLLNKYKERTTLCKEISAALPETLKMFDTTVFRTRIRECEDCKKAPSARMSIQQYAPGSTTAQDYWKLCEEIIGR
ncbi:MAG: ParA family protein [Roseburia sp.]